MKTSMIFGLAALALTGCMAGRQNQSTVAVQGVGTVYAQPDVVRMSVMAAHTAATSREAQQGVNRRTGMVMDVLRGATIADKDIQTTQLSLNPQYEWRNERNVLVGQRAEQRLSFTLRELGKVSALVDSLVEIEGIELGGISFDIDDNAANFASARELAFTKARAKAEQYAALAGLRVGRVLSVAEDAAAGPMPMLRNAMAKGMMLEASVADAAVPAGQQEVSTNVSVVFELK